jgi:hypothetical protein
MGWWDSIFGYPDRPNNQRQPSSRGSMLGLAYQGLPDAKAKITDQRHDDIYRIKMADDARSTDWDEGWRTRPYDPSLPDAAASGRVIDPSETVGPLFPSDDEGAYKPSFQQNWRPRYSRQAPYLDPRMGPQTEQNMSRAGQAAGPDDLTDSNRYAANYLPPIPEHLPWAPGERGWATPPSLSGPHNRAGDPARPGYDNSLMSVNARGLTLNSNPWGY